RAAISGRSSAPLPRRRTPCTRGSGTWLKMMRDFWKSAGFSLLKPDPEGKLAVTADFLRAYFTRPEIHPIDESGPNEVALFEALMADPFMAVSAPRLEAIEDSDTRDNYRVVLRFRDLLVEAGTVEG